MFFETNIGELLTIKLEQVLDIEKNAGNGVFDGTATMHGFQTNGLHEKEDYKSILEDLLSFTPSEFKDFKYRWFHLIDYDRGGWQIEHDHSRTETMSFVVYLTTCNEGGKTFFRTSDTEVFESAPVRGKLILFPAYLRHWGEEVIDPKRVAVGALRSN
jgi:hypothetical protein